MKTFYNDNEPYVVRWLENLVLTSEISYGDVSDKSIREIESWQLAGYNRCHFFAGIGGWDLALRLAGWPADREVWTGSCPCQPFSVAATDRQQGVSDARHLWPEFFRLISDRHPPTIFGEQVPNAIRHGWLDEVFRDLEREGYACGAVILPASSCGAEHRRDRLYWVADSSSKGRARYQPLQRLPVAAEPPPTLNGDSLIRARVSLAGDYSGLLPCDGLSVAVERMAIKGYGNAIVPQVAATFIRAFMEAE